MLVVVVVVVMVVGAMVVAVVRGEGVKEQEVGVETKMRQKRKKRL